MIFITGHLRARGYDRSRSHMPLKEAYFSADTISSVTQEFLAGCQHLSRRERLPFDPDQSALLVLDMQAYFLDVESHAYIPSAPAIIPGLMRLVQAYAARQLPVYFTRHTNTPQNSGQMSAWWRDLIDPEKPASAIAPDIDLSRGVVIEKHQYDAFFNSSLETSLGSHQNKQLVIGGVMTHLCCETTARSAFLRGYQVFFLVDGTATYNRHFHQASLLNLAHGFATIVCVGDILNALEKGR